MVGRGYKYSNVQNKIIQLHAFLATWDGVSLLALKQHNKTDHSMLRLSGI